MMTRNITIAAGLVLALAALPAMAQTGGSTLANSGLGFEFATRFFSPNDSRFQGGSNVFRLNFGGTEELKVFFEREETSFTFKNSGTGAPGVPGSMTSEGIGLAIPFTPAVRVEILAGRATTTVNGAAVGGATLSSSDPLMDLGLFWAYPVGKAFIDLGLLYRTLKLSGSIPGNTLDGTGTTSAKSVDDLGGLLVNVGLGYAF